MSISLNTNGQIAALFAAQTYAERMELARFLASAMREWVADGQEADDNYFADLLESWELEASSDD
ncbi:hypothetical protein [Devosia sp.]|uniref:hypothetical protein n=1 Tax=Devosia sp. TaxID=1871048 RepID=UPI002AFE24C0|nr:hypothetical protein [Devosia sp.]